MADLRLGQLLGEVSGGRERIKDGAGLATMGPRLNEYDVSALSSDELGSEFEALVALYRAVRSLDAVIQSQARRSEITGQLSLIYYRLRSIHGGLAARYAIDAGIGTRPDTSPVGTAIGLYDVSKIRAQQTHLESGSYDTMLPWFVR